MAPNASRGRPGVFRLGKKNKSAPTADPKADRQCATRRVCMAGYYMAGYYVATNGGRGGPGVRDVHERRRFPERGKPASVHPAVLVRQRPVRPGRRQHLRGCCVRALHARVRATFGKPPPAFSIAATSTNTTTETTTTATSTTHTMTTATTTTSTTTSTTATTDASTDTSTATATATTLGEVRASECRTITCVDDCVGLCSWNRAGLCRSNAGFRSETSVPSVPPGQKYAYTLRGQDVAQDHGVIHGNVHGHFSPLPPLRR